MSDNTGEIDLIELLKKIYLEKKFIIKISIVASLFGVVYALFQPNQFTSSTTFIPQLSSGINSNSSALGSFASIAGINIGNSTGNSSEFPTTLYPQVVNGIPFKLELLSSIIELDGKEIIVKDYFLEKSSSKNLFSFIKKESKKINKSNIYVINKEDKDLFKTIDDALSLTINKNEGFITISCVDSNKNIAAQITRIAQDLLQKKIIEFKNQSSKEVLDFALKQYDEKKIEYEKLQDERAIFVDKNINISSSLFQNKLSRIESDVNILQSIVQQLASQVEQAKLQLNKNTPVFTTIHPVSVPYQRTAPKRKLIVIFFAFAGFAFSVGYILLKKPILKIFKHIKS